MSNNFTETTLAYLAGFFDGEGTVVINHRKGKKYEDWTLSVGVANHCEAPITLFAKVFGGYVKLANKPNVCRFSLYLGGPRAAVMLTALLPYLCVKRRQALCGIRFQKRVRATFDRKAGLSRAEKALRAEMRDEMRSLNGRFNNRAKNRLLAEKGVACD